MSDHPALLQAIVENVPHMIFVKDAEELSFVLLNRAGEELLGMGRKELLGKNDYDFFPPSEAEFFQSKDRETLRNGALVDIPRESIETRGGPRILHTKKVPIFDAERVPRYLLGISEDITARIAGEEAQARLAAIVRDCSDAIVGRDRDGHVSSWNFGAEQMFGYQAEEMLGRRLDVLVPARLRDEEAHITERCLAGERIRGLETVRHRKDGQEVEVSLTLSPVRAADGQITGVSGVMREITELKLAQRQTEIARERAESAIRELEAFSYSVAHDLRAPLRGIDGFSQALLEDCAEQLDAQGRRYLERVRGSAQRMARLIDDLLMLSRVTRAELRTRRVDLAALALASFEKHRIETSRLSVEPNLWAHGEPSLLSALLDNLIGNACKFTSKRPQPHIELGFNAADGAFFVRDNGAGFDPRYAHKLFGAFQRLHSTAEFEGTGVGLAIVQRIVSRHGGRIWAEGAVDHGATFFFTLPAGGPE